MKVIFTLVALATAALASNLEERWDKTTQSPDHTKSITKVIYTTYTTPCEVTSTKTVGGHEVYVTYTEISTVVEEVKTTKIAYTTAAPVTKYIETEVIEYETTLCPVTVVSTVSGVPVTVVHTETSVITKVIPTTIVQYTTAYETAEVFQTESEFVTKYTTVSADSTIVITETFTSTVDVTLFYTLTSTFEPPTTKATVVIPVTEISSAAVYEVTTIPSEKTLTEVPTVQSVVSYTIVQTSEAPPPTTTLPPTTIVTSVAVSSTTSSAPVQFSANAAVENRAGGVAMFAGAGIAAFLAVV